MAHELCECAFLLSLCNLFIKKSPFLRAVGIKNSWKYEKDLILVLNSKKPRINIP